MAKDRQATDARLAGGRPQGRKPKDKEGELAIEVGPEHRQALSRPAQAPKSR